MITYIVPTVGRPSLRSTLRSIETRDGDEVILVGDINKLAAIPLPGPNFKLIQCAPCRDWGHGERNFATPFASGRYIAHIDDDDSYRPGTRALFQDAIEKNPDKPTLFRMQYPNGITLWQEKADKFHCGNIGTPCFLIPNVPEKLGHWGSFVGGDFSFLETSGWTPEEFVWRPEVICSLGHNV